MSVITTAIESGDKAIIDIESAISHLLEIVEPGVWGGDEFGKLRILSYVGALYEVLWALGN